MRSISALLTIVVLAGCALSVGAQELNKKQKQPWNALERQVGLWFKQDWEKHEKYIHPKSVIWNDDLPAPVSRTKTMPYMKAMLQESDEVVAHYLTPVTVTVVDDVAIINCFVQVLTRKDSELVESTYKLHNTWKKEDGRWLLLATCNSVVQEGEPAE